MQNDTRSRLNTWVNPDTGIPFWVAPRTAKFGEDITLGARGAYGGGNDTYAYWTDSNPNGGEGNSNNRTMLTKYPEICGERLGTAVGYTRAILQSASKRLPPLVKDLRISPNLATPGAKVEIIFTALENRSRNLKYSLNVTRDGVTETILVGMMALNNPKPISYNNSYPNDPNNNRPSSVPENYLYNFSGKVAWPGHFAGKPLAEGAYAIEVSLTDEDGNTVPADVNTDSIRENDSKTVLTVVNTLPKEEQARPSFGRN